MAQEQHSKIINQVARKMLKPYGIIQKGSREWFDDGGWFSTAIGFQSSQWRKGSYLAVGVNFHWYKSPYLLYDIGGRENNFDFVEYKNDGQFTEDIEDFCRRIIEKVLSYREALITLYSAKNIIMDCQAPPMAPCWCNYHKGTICGLTGDFDGLNKFYSEVLKEDSTQHWTCENTGIVHSSRIQWIDDLKENVKHLLSKKSNLELFKIEIIKIIYEARKMKKLPEIEIKLNNKIMG